MQTQDVFVQRCDVQSVANERLAKRYLVSVHQVTAFTDKVCMRLFDNHKDKVSCDDLWVCLMAFAFECQARACFPAFADRNREELLVSSLGSTIRTNPVALDRNF